MKNSIRKTGADTEKSPAVVFYRGIGMKFLFGGIGFLLLLFFIRFFPTNLDGSQELPYLVGGFVLFSCLLLCIGAGLILLCRFSPGFRARAEQKWRKEAEQKTTVHTQRQAIKAVVISLLVILILVAAFVFFTGVYRQQTYTEPIAPEDYRIVDLFVEDMSDGWHIYTVAYVVNGVAYTADVNMSHADGELIEEARTRGAGAEELIGTLYYHADNPGYIGRIEQ